MFAPERMRKVAVIGPQTVMDKAVRELHRLRAVHIIAHEKGELDIGRPFEKAERLSALLVTLRAISSALGISGKKELSNGFRAVGLKSFAELESAVKKLNMEVTGVLAGVKEAEDGLKRLESREAQLSLVGRLGLDLDSLSDCRSLSHFIGTVNDAGLLKKSILAVTDRFELFVAGDGSHPVIALFIDAAKRNDAAEVLSGNGFSELQLAELDGMKGKPGDALSDLAKARDKLKRQLEAGNNAKAGLGLKWNDFLLLGEQIIEGELEKAEAPLMFGVSSKAFAVEGWIPAGSLPGLEHALGKATGERIFVESELPHHDDIVPVKMDNPKQAKPFEFFMSLYALPRYDEIDPTLFMMVTFPLFFGFILGDVGYGLVTFFLLLWLKVKFPAASQLVRVIIPAAVSSIIFGFVFGEVFGFERAFGIEFPHLVSRADEVIPMAIVSLIIGLLHINLGLVLGFINEFRHAGFFRAFSAKASWILLQVGIGLFILSLMKKIPLPLYIPAAAAAVFVALITKAEGFRGLIELPGLLSNLMSYARLAAVGLSSVILAVVVNDLSTEIAHAGPVGMAFAVLVLFIGHTINLALGLLGGFLHSMRLHYVEFFTKFFEGGAIPFRPFGSKQG